ncbi:MAG: phosphatidate cytidylyltransferase [Armatimonadetes bacterium]|nr:phosphatidate cytidylyltransferase [Armatimonadota bacterium]
MLKERIGSAAWMIPLALLLACFGGLWIALPLAVLACLAVGEFTDKAGAKEIRVLQPLATVCAVGFLALTELSTRGAGSMPPERYGKAVMALAFVLVMGTLAANVWCYHRDQTTHVTVDAAATVLVAMYVGVSFSFLLLLRGFGSGFDSARICWIPLPYGARLLLFTFFATWATDTGAYFVGKNLGVTKLTPASPNKTLEGTVGGIVCALLVALVGGWLLEVGLGFAFLAGLLVGVTAQVGDLAKSVLKRDLGTKDFGDLIPGHGGVLDRLDSLMMTVPLVYILAAISM